ncbi:hypothetical protein [Streptomyces sp. NPDC001601]|uniref:hypothetical protein n=1 Tax=Streptomyces sp. NPDC001601 TaxID=3364592 RepID=UPI0036B6B5FB
MDVTALKVFFGPVPTGVTAVTATAMAMATGGCGEPRGFSRPGAARPEPARPPLLHPREGSDASDGTGEPAVRA